ncbi:unnamed protein product [Taenia asiatica]|uniref:Uncharacterized protein n=1 Tax=Taenia asiatica TaxID=60517 RepID=A0A0R3VXV6_TAEAS|nr:unnamed protein product [Taenia asiatica]
MERRVRCEVIDINAVCNMSWSRWRKVSPLCFNSKALKFMSVSFNLTRRIRTTLWWHNHHPNRFNWQAANADSSLILVQAPFVAVATTAPKGRYSDPADGPRLSKRCAQQHFKSTPPAAPLLSAFEIIDAP